MSDEVMGSFSVDPTGYADFMIAIYEEWVRYEGVMLVKKQRKQRSSAGRRNRLHGLMRQSVRIGGNNEKNEKNL